MHSVTRRVSLLLGLLAAAFIALGVVSGTSEQRRLRVLMRAARSDLEFRSDVNRIFGMKSVKFAALTDDYTIWDEMVRFAQKPDGRWAADNLDTSLDLYHAACIWVVSPNLKLAHLSASVSDPTARALPVATQDLAAALPHGKTTRFYYWTRSGLMIVRGSRIYRSNDPGRKGQSFGYFMAGHLWDAADAAELSRLVGCPVTLLDGRPGSHAPAPRRAANMVTLDRPLLSWDGKTVASVRYEYRSDAAAMTGELARRQLWMTSGFMSVAYVAVLVGLLLWVSTPLRTIRTALRSKGGGLSGLSSSKTEFGAVARNLVEFFQQQDELQREIEERKRTAAALQQSEEQYRRFFQLNPVPCLVYDTATLGFLDVNEAAVRYFGYQPDDLLAVRLPDLGVPGATDQLIEAAQSGEGIQRVEGLSLRTHSGDEVLADGTSHPIAVAGRAARLLVLYDVTERQRAAAQLRAMATELSRSNRELSDFASTASHDLQEPLRKVQAFSSRLTAKLGAALTDDGREYLTRMNSAIDRMHSLIQDLLTYSRVTSRAKPFERVDLATVAREVLGDLEARVEQVGGRVEIGDLPTIDADPSQMRQLLQNFMGNALKFRKPEVAPVVTVSATEIEQEGQRMCRLVVQDNGIGFESQYAERIFGLFERLHGRGEYEGSGMGLAICKKIVERHGGHVSAEGRPDVGATLIADLPMQHASPQAAAEG